MNLLEYLHSVGLATKITDIAISQTNTPSHLREDAAQDIHIMWMTKTPNFQYQPSQIAAYAHAMAKHAALRCRREIGSAVRLPGSAFRKRKDGSTYVEPGAIANPLDWAEMDEWFSLEGQHDAASAGIGQGDSPDDYTENMFIDCDNDEEEGTHEVVEYTDNERRHETFLRVEKKLSCRGREILLRLLQNQSLVRIQLEMGLTSPTIVSREMTKVKQILIDEGLRLCDLEPSKPEKAEGSAEDSCECCGADG